MSTETNKTIVRQWLLEMWGSGNLALVDDMTTPDYVYTEPGVGRVEGREALKGLVTTYRTAFPDLTNTIETQVAEGDQVVTRGTTRGTHRGELSGIAPTDKTVAVEWVLISRLADGKLVEEWELLNALSMMQQLGVIPSEQRNSTGMPLESGTRLGFYDLQSRLGSGGMGEVWKAYDPKLQRTVAIKVLKETEDAACRILAEARAASGLSHPNICTVYDVGEADGQSFIVMEYVQGQPLSELIPADGLPPETVIRYGTQIADALAHAHEKGIIHRDLKSANIVITPEGRAKVLDFGVADRLPDADADAVTKTFEMTDRAGLLVGTLAYMAPELLRGETATVRSDIWALGVVLYQMMSARLPFSGGTPVELTAATLKESVPPLATRVPSGLRAVVQRCLSKEAGHRYATCGELHAALEASPVSQAAPQPGPSLATTSPSIAVLPFTDMSPEQDQEYFCHGITEEILNGLAAVRGLRVAARTSSFQAKARGFDIPEIGARLKVSTILEGSVRKAGERIRITAQLVSVSDGYQLWSARYDRTLEDIFEIQDEIARTIAEELRGTPTPADRSRMRRQHAMNLEAYTLYLKGRFFWNRRTTTGLQEALKIFQQVTQLDPEYAPAHSGLSDTYNLLGILWALPPSEAHELAREAASRALALDDTLAEAHNSLAIVYSAFDWNWEEAKRSFTRALQLRPDYPPAHHFYAGYYLQPMGRHDEAIAEMRQAQELDPLSPILGADSGWVLHWAGHNDEAIDQLLRTIERFPDFPLSYYYLAFAYVQRGLGAEAIAAARKSVSMTGDAPIFVAGLGHALAATGRVGDAKEVLDRLIVRKREEPVPSYHLALICTTLGDIDQAFGWLDQAYEERSWLPWFRYQHGFAPLASDARFGALVRRLNLPE